MHNIINDFRNSGCPLCCSHKLIYLGLISYNQSIQFSSEAVRLEKKPELWKCKKCLSAFVQNVVTPDTAQRLYAQGHSASRWSAVAFEEHKPHEIVAELARLFTNGKQHLDVGCSAGNLLDFSKERGCLTTGIDYSSTTRDFVERKGHAWFPSLEALGPRNFDIITAFDVIEHLYDVRAFLQECRRRLQPGGRLVILTGNIDSLSARLTRHHWWYVSYPEHIVFPSIKFFRECAAYTVENCVYTYASIVYRRPLQERLRGVLLGLLRGRYRGLPAVGPDHMLLILGT